MRTIFIGASGHAYPEIVKTYSRLIEMPDGYHPVTKGAIYRDSKKREQALMIMWHDVSDPDGADLTADYIDVLKENETLKICKEKPSVNKMWWRHFTSGLFQLLRVGYFVFFVCIMTFWLILLTVVV